MIYLVKNPAKQEKTYFDEATSSTAKADADALLLTVRQEVLEKEAYRFSINKETVVGNDTMWSAADLENDPEVYDYLVFNQKTGTYQKCTTLSEAKALNIQMQTEFLTNSGLDAPEELEKIPEPIKIKTLNQQ